MKLFLIDGSGFLYRAYYAFPALHDKDGHNTNVIYGFLRMLFRIFQEKPDYLVIAWDAPTKTLRHEEYPEYKANRKKMEDDFKDQIPLTKHIVQQLAIPNLTNPGYEADDIIHTLTKKFRTESNLDIDIYSSDKDLKQLLDENVFSVDPMKSLRTDTAAFVQEFSFSPSNILDYLALVGDSSDNIKGVAGIGPKKASELIQKYTDLNGIYSHIEDISGDLKQKLLDGKESAYHSRGLIELRNVPELEKIILSDLKLEIDFIKYKKILIEDYHFSSFDKVLDELKKKLQTPTQTALF